MRIAKCCEREVIESLSKQREGTTDGNRNGTISHITSEKILKNRVYVIFPRFEQVTGNRPFPSYLWPLFQSESSWLSLHMKISFHLHVNEN